MMQKYKLRKNFELKRLYFRLKKQKKNVLRRKKVNFFRLKTLGFFFLWINFFSKNLNFLLKKKYFFNFCFKSPQPKPDFFLKNVSKTWTESYAFFLSRFSLFFLTDFFFNYQILIFFQKILFNKFFFFKFFFFKFFFFKFFFFKFFFFKLLLK